jgi:hypothetical protein
MFCSDQGPWIIDQVKAIAPEIPIVTSVSFRATDVGVRKPRYASNMHVGLTYMRLPILHGLVIYIYMLIIMSYL